MAVEHSPAEFGRVTVARSKMYMPRFVPAPVRPCCDPCEALLIVQDDMDLNFIVLRAREEILAAQDVEPASPLTGKVVAAMFALVKLIEGRKSRKERGAMRRAVLSLANWDAKEMEKLLNDLVAKGPRQQAALKTLRSRAMQAGRSVVLPICTVRCQISVLQTVALHNYSDAMCHALQLLQHMSASSILHSLVPHAANVRFASRSAVPRAAAVPGGQPCGNDLSGLRFAAAVAAAAVAAAAVVPSSAI